jgi:hypothetical protein
MFEHSAILRHYRVGAGVGKLPTAFLTGQGYGAFQHIITPRHQQVHGFSTLPSRSYSQFSARVCRHAPVRITQRTIARIFFMLITPLNIDFEGNAFQNHFDPLIFA